MVQTSVERRVVGTASSIWRVNGAMQGVVILIIKKIVCLLCVDRVLLLLHLSIYLFLLQRSSHTYKVK